MSKPILLLICEEYGYQNWFGVYSQRHYDNIVRRWNTMRGLNCLVPVDFVIPGARLCVTDNPVCISEIDQYEIRRAHVHQCDDSYLDGANRVPNADNFEIDGVVYSREEIVAKLDESRANVRAYLSQMHPECDAVEENSAAF